jgi:aspartate aminotransferase-like enzyme
VKRLRDTHGIVVAGGQDRLKGTMIRIGHMGAYDRADAIAVVSALEECTRALGGPDGADAAAAASLAWERAG